VIALRLADVKYVHSGTNPQLAADKNLVRRNDAVLSTHLNVKMIPVTSRQERRSR
jgi:hypothetical protein